MSDRDDLERRLEAWLDATARPMPPDVFDEVVATVPRIARAGTRAEFPSGRRWRVAIAGLAAGVILAVGLGIAFRPPIGPGTSGTPTASGTPAASRPVESNPPTEAPTEAPSRGEWHRNNNNAGEEQLVCREGTDFWTCDYRVPNGTGSFIGQLVTGSWTCPGWFPRTICADVTAVYRGYFTVDEPPAGQPSEKPEIVAQEYLITQVAGQPVLQLYWVDRFVCPWYRTFEAAMAADYHCVVAP